MEWLERDPIPEGCKDCKEEDCYNCDIAGERWYLSESDELQVKRKMLVKSIERAERKIFDIDLQLLPFTDEQRDALTGKSYMSYDLWWDCLEVACNNDNMEMYKAIWSRYPDLVIELAKRTDNDRIVPRNKR